MLAGFVDDLGLEPYDVPARRGELKTSSSPTPPTASVMCASSCARDRTWPCCGRACRAAWSRCREAAVVSVNLSPSTRPSSRATRRSSLTAATAADARQRALSWACDPTASSRPTPPWPPRSTGRRVSGSRIVARLGDRISTAASAGSRCTPLFQVRRRCIGDRGVARRRRKRPDSASELRAQRPDVGPIAFRGRRCHDATAAPTSRPGRPRRRQPAAARHRTATWPGRLEESAAGTSSTRAATSTSWPATSRSMPSYSARGGAALRHVPPDARTTR